MGHVPIMEPILHLYVPFREHIPYLFIATSANLPVCLGTWNVEKPRIDTKVLYNICAHKSYLCHLTFGKLFF